MAAAATGWNHRDVALSSTDIDASQPRLYRAVEGRVLAGVALGIAKHLRLRPLLVRIGFLVLTGFGGFGLLLYAGFWAVVPPEPGALPVRGGLLARIADRGPVVAAGAVVLGVLVG